MYKTDLYDITSVIHNKYLDPNIGDDECLFVMNSTIKSLFKIYGSDYEDYLVRLIKIVEASECAFLAMQEIINAMFDAASQL